MTSGRRSKALRRVATQAQREQAPNAGAAIAALTPEQRGGVPNRAGRRGQTELLRRLVGGAR